MSKKTLYANLGRYLRRSRIERDLTQKHVAEQLGYTSSQFISNFERGLCAPALDKLGVLIRLYDLSAKDLYNMIVEEYSENLRRHLLMTGAKAKRSPKRARNSRFL